MRYGFIYNDEKQQQKCFREPKTPLKIKMDQAIGSDSRLESSENSERVRQKLLLKPDTDCSFIM